MYDMKITTVRQVPKVLSSPIDYFLEQEDLDRIYEVWGKGVTKFGWEEPVSHRGGVFSITVKMMKSIPEEQLLKIYFTRRTERILKALERAV